MHPYVANLISKLGIDPKSKPEDIKADLMERPLDTIWRALCGLANAASYAGEERWLCAIATEVKMAQQPKELKKPTDPYWSLWGRLKSEERQITDIRELDNYIVEKFGSQLSEEIEDQYSSNRLPQTKFRCRLVGDTILVGSVWKLVRGDVHAVNFLRKFDTDADYRAAQQQNP